LPKKQNNNNYHHKNAYCLDCGADKGKSVAYAIQKWYYKQIESWLITNGLAEKKLFQGEELYSFYDFIKFIQENHPNLEQHWNDLFFGKIDKDFDGLLGQGIFFETAKSIEYICGEFKKEKQNIPNTPQPRKGKDNNNHREREREREQIQQDITNLENRPNKTPAEEQELTDKKNKLAKLENNTQNNNDNSWLKPALLIGGGLLIIGVIVILITKKAKSKR